MLGLCLFSVQGMDICRQIETGELSDADLTHLSGSIHTHSVPQAGRTAGQFIRIPRVDSVVDCVRLCCDRDACDVMLFHTGACYMVQCDVGVFDGCRPVQRSWLDATMVVVRQPEYLPDSGKKFTDASATSSDERPSSFTARFCEYGLRECPQDELCVLRGPSNGRSRFGVCECLPNYWRDSAGICQPSPPPSIALDSQKRGDQNNVTVSAAARAGITTVTKLTVSAGENKVLQLPENSITLSVFALPKAAQDEEYHYEWTPVGQPEGSEETATMQGQNTDTLKLSNLIAGVYRLQVQVTGENKFGKASVNITVLPPKRQNQPPVAVITPAQQQVKSENTFILDGSESTDDDGITSYHWEEVSGPLQEYDIDEDTQTLTLKDMAPGHYVFRLTVTDTDGATNSTSANVTVIKEKDYPPKANAGSDVIIHLPQKSVVLCGNASTDDKAIASYEWIKKSDSLTADMTGVRTVCLQLNNLELGDYTFTLNVLDTAGNAASADIHVYVKPEMNHPPVAKTSGEMTVTLPADHIVLDGRSSTDGERLVSYTWTQTGGPTSLTLTHSDQAVATATGDIVAGDYEFKLTVGDVGEQTSSDQLKVHVKMDENQAPVARAGGNKLALLPLSLVTLDGSASYDDKGITFYLWQRHSNSLAAGDVVNNSDRQAVLQLINLVAGRYVFTLTVTDDQGLSSVDTASLVVKNGEAYKDLMELVVDTDIHRFSQEDKINVIKQLELLVRQSSRHSASMIQVQSLEEERTRGQVRLTFFVQRSDGSMANGPDIVHLLRDQLEDNSVLPYSVVSLDTVGRVHVDQRKVYVSTADKNVHEQDSQLFAVCQKNCSGHGQCDPRTRTCRCEAFWMPNLITLFYRQHTNCEWSVIYFVVACFVAIVAVVGSLWGIICCCQSKRCCSKSRKRRRYALLEDADDDDDDRDDMELLPKGKMQKSSVMMSESELSSDEETLFTGGKKISSHAKNGHAKPAT